MATSYHKCSRCGQPARKRSDLCAACVAWAAWYNQRQVWRAVFDDPAVTEAQLKVAWDRYHACFVAWLDAVGTGK